jgi:hypothetical protein
VTELAYFVLGAVLATLVWAWVSVRAVFFTVRHYEGRIAMQQASYAKQQAEDREVTRKLDESHRALLQDLNEAGLNSFRVRVKA